MARIDKIGIARMAVRILEPRLRSEGKLFVAQSNMPKRYELKIGILELMLVENALLLPDDPTLSSALYVWVNGQGKVLNVSWCPQRPWAPPHVSNLKAGQWMDTLQIQTPRPT